MSLPDETTTYCSRCSDYNIEDECCICKDCISKIFEDMDLELMLTDIKDKKGNKIPESEELMELFDIFWRYVRTELESKLTLSTGDSK